MGDFILVTIIPATRTWGIIEIWRNSYFFMLGIVFCNARTNKIPKPRVGKQMIYQPLVILMSKLARGVEMSVVSYHPEAVCSWFKLTE